MQGRGPYTNFTKASIANVGGDVRAFAGEDLQEPQPYLEAPQHNYASINASGKPVGETPFDYDLVHDPTPNMSYERHHPGAFQGIQTTMGKHLVSRR